MEIMPAMFTPPPMTCLPAEFLRNGGSLDRLTSEFKIQVRRHQKYHNLVQLRYNQIESDFHIPLVRQCRGIILDEAKRWEPIARPFDKFFNYGEELAAQIHWSSARVQEKLDGTLIILYHYDSRWNVATIGVPDASGAVQGAGELTFADLFWHVWKQRKYTPPSNINTGYTFMFELTSPYNRVVVKQDRSDIKLIGIRNTWTGTEISPGYSNDYEAVKQFDLRTIDDVRIALEKLDPLDQEGYVVVDSHFRRIKIKHPGYVALHHLKDGFNLKRVVDVVRKGEEGEIVATFPEWGEVVEQVKTVYDGLALVIQQNWDEVKDISDRKEFAEHALLMACPFVLFQLFDGKVASAKHGLSKMHIDRLTDLLGVDDLQLIGSM